MGMYFCYGCDRLFDSQGDTGCHESMKGKFQLVYEDCHEKELEAIARVEGE